MKVAGEGRRDHCSPANNEGGRKMENLVTGRSLTHSQLNLSVTLNMCNSDTTNEIKCHQIEDKHAAIYSNSY